MTFSTDHASALLAYITLTDPRLASNLSADACAARESIWAKQLADADPVWVMRYAERHYARQDAPLLMVGTIREAWKTHARAEESKTRDYLPASVPPPTGLMDYLRACFAAVQAGRPVATVPKPPSVRVLSTAADRRSRVCPFVRLCACDHTACRDGWLDESDLIMRNGLTYEQVKRCPFCADAALMAEDSARAAEKIRRGRR